MALPIETFKLIDSTNAEAARQLAAGRPPGFAVRADQQSAGRGRRGRNWASPPGNLYCSIVLGAGSLPAGDLALICSVAVADAVLACAPEADIALKWPNDVLLGGAKLAGILLERQGNAVSPVIIGIGVNLADKPLGTPYPAACLADIAVKTAPDDLLRHIIAQLEGLIAVVHSRGLAPIRKVWLARAAGLGAAITVRLVDGKMQGIFKGLAKDGRLQLGLADGSVELISAGDVFFAPGAGRGLKGHVDDH